MKEITIAGVRVNALTEEDAVVVTPEIASQLMAQDNENFRKVSRAEVARHVKSMADGEWRFNGDSVAIDSKGLVKDGQHRLLGCEESKVGLKTFLMRIGNDMNIDNKKKLSFDKILQGLGHRNHTALAATIKILYREHHQTTSFFTTKNEIENNQLITFFEENPDISDSFRFTMTYYAKTDLPHSVLAAFYHLTRKIDPNLARSFVHTLSLPLDEYKRQDISEYNSMYHLKRALSKPGKDEKIPTAVKIALTIKAWNFWREESICQKLQWRTTGASPEPFPTIK
jgi:hypothetical protein